MNPTEARTDVPFAECEQHHPCLAVADLHSAIDFYTTKLAFQLAFTQGDPPSMAGLNLGCVQIFLERGTPAPKGCSIYFVVGDADELHDFHRSKGVQIVREPGNRPYELRDYTIRDLDGYHLTFGHRLLNTGPRLRIQRVDVPVRLEKRLAALLQDLATHKRMSLTSCLEEILLHTCEPFGDGVANPHTKKTLEYIQELKAKHGIDYDTHASYRFTEDEPPPSSQSSLPPR